MRQLRPLPSFPDRDVATGARAATRVARCGTSGVDLFTPHEGFAPRSGAPSITTEG